MRHLLSMSAGIQNDEPSREDVDRKALYSLDEIIAEFADADLRFSPGEMFEYCNSCYQLLGAIIESCSKRSYSDHLKTRIFDSLSMQNTGVFSSFEDQARGFYLGANRERKSIDPREMAIHCSHGFSSGGLVTCLADMEKWDEALYDEAFLTTESRRKITDVGKCRTIFDPSTGTYDQTRYGFGFFIDGQGEILFHGGLIPGFSSFIVRDTTTRDCVVVLSNQMFNNTPEEAPLTEKMASYLWEIMRR